MYILRVSTFSHVIDIAQNFCTDTVTTAEKSAPPPAALLLLLSRTCYDLQLNTAQYLMAMVDEQFLIEDTGGLTSVPKINGLLKTVSQMLLNHYVKMQGGIMSQMLRKSVETRDWLNTVEPRSVRAVMKRVVEEVTAVDRQVGGGGRDMWKGRCMQTKYCNQAFSAKCTVTKSWTLGGMNSPRTASVVGRRGGSRVLRRTGRPVPTS